MPKSNYWVEFTFTYKMWSPLQNNWVDNKSYQSMKITCYKKDIENEVEKWVNNKLNHKNVKDININIFDYYQLLA